MFNSVAFFFRTLRRVTFLGILCLNIPLSGQDSNYNYYYRVSFTDKGMNHVESFPPASLLSEKAIQRREKSEIPVPDYFDLPVYSDYLEEISSMGLTLHTTSKWMNTGLFKSTDPVDPSVILSLQFVSDIKLVKNPASKSNFTDKLDFPLYEADDFPYDRPVTMLNGDLLHDSGFDGNGVLIAVLDAGFLNTDLITSLQQLRNRKGIRVTYDFVNNDQFVYSYHNHGTAVLSVLAGVIDGYIRGTAPGADYMLFRTEDDDSEFPVEEDFWVAAAEFADSAGADIISSSLGYSIFDDPILDYKYSDMDGNSTFITRAADIAASKGILVVNSAGNERNKTWLHILAPSDGDSVLASGAVDGNNIISSFSSAGPAADRRVKPDLTTMGVKVPVQVNISSLSRSSGTSFSCPVLSGMTACLLQAVPSAVNTDIIWALHNSGDKYTFPDSLYGYGTPNMVNALNILQELHIIKPSAEFTTGPNPTNGEIQIIFREDPGAIKMEIFNASGILIIRKNIPRYAGRTLRIQYLADRNDGLYYIRIKTDNGIFTQKIIKISRR